MKNSKAFVGMVAIALVAGVLAAGLIASAAGPPAVGVGTATSFAVLAGAGITNTGPTTITGDVGTFPTTTEAGFGSVTAYNAAAVSRPTGDPLGPLTILGTALAGIGCLLLVRRPAPHL